MPAERNALRLGSALAVFFVLFAAILVFLAPRGRGDMALQVRFPHNTFSTVIQPGAQVTCGGVTVGRVRSVRLEEQPDETRGTTGYYSVVTLVVDSSVGLRRDCRIVPAEQLIGGLGTLVIEDRGLGEPLKPWDTVDGFPAASIATLTRSLTVQLDERDPKSLLSLIKTQLDADDARSLLGKIHASLDDINAITRNVQAEFNPRDRQALLAKIHGIMDHLNDLTRLVRDEMDAGRQAGAMDKVHRALDTLNAGLATVSAMLEENRPALGRTLANADETSAILKDGIAARLAEELDARRPGSLLARIHGASDRIARSLADLNDITRTSRDLLVLNRQQIGQMITNLKETSDHLKGASKELRRSPWRLLYQPTVEEAAQANLFDAARAFAEAATRLDDAAARLQAAAEEGEAGAVPDEEVLRSIRDDLQRTFDHFHKAEAAFWEQLGIR